MIAIVLVLLAMVLAAAGVALARLSAWNGEPDVETAETAAPALLPYSQEVAQRLAQAEPPELTTLKHLRRHGMQTFFADRDSPLLRRLARSGLLSPMGSSAYPADAYPYRVPDEVWAQLAPRTQARPDSSQMREDERRPR